MQWLRRYYGLILGLALFSLVPKVNAEDGTCGTLSLDEETSMNLPWYDNNQMLYDYLEDQGYYGNSGGGIIIPQKMGGGCLSSTCDPIKYLVPLNIWIYRDSNGNGPTDEANVYGWLDRVNIIFDNADTGIQFYIQSLGFENHNNYYEGIGSDFDMTEMFVAKGYSNRDALNIHFILRTDGDWDDLGHAILPHGFAVPFTRYSAFIRTHELDGIRPRTDENIASTFAHELGHTLGLLHTHNPGRLFSQIFNEDNATISNGCYQEAVYRGKRNRFFKGCISTGGRLKCEINGDFLCDTEADPNSLGRVDVNCNYEYPSGGDFRSDNWGAAWQPPTNNIMAYTNPACRNEFSEGQISIMWMVLENWFQGRGKPALQGPNQLPCFPGNITLSAPEIEGVISYNWSVTSFNLRIMGSSNGSQINVQALNSFSSNLGCVTLDIVTRYGTFCLTKQILPGRPAPVSITTNSPSNHEICANSPVQFRANMISHGGVTNYHWTVSNGTITGGQGSSSATIVTPSANQWVTVNVAVTNSCGTTTGVTNLLTRNTVNGFYCSSVINPKTDGDEKSFED